jgi:hypothetical protein
MFRAAYGVVVCLVLASAASACAGRPRPELTPPLLAPSSSPVVRFVATEVIGELKDFGESLGGHATENFLRHSDRYTADNRCYFTGKLQLPEFYSGLRMVRENEANCIGRADQHDVFFYPVQAVASGEETVTVSLAEAPLERVLVVVPHEDFHNQPEARKAPTEVAEAAATLVGFLTASGFAKEKFGADSTTFRMLDRDVDLFLRKSVIVNLYYEKVSGLYRAFRSGVLTPAETLNRKAELFEALRQSCSEISPDPVSFNKCPAALNNAGLAFDRTYTQNYQLIHDLYRLLGSDTAALVSTLKRLLASWPHDAEDATDLMGAARVVSR